MLSRKQKEQLVEEESKRLEKNETLVLTDFAGLPVGKANMLRKSLKEIGATYKVVKKRLLNLVFQKHDVKINPKELKGQIGVVFSPKDIAETSQIVYKFGKENKENFKIVGGVEVKERKVLSAEEVNAIGSLPPREVLLGQLVYMIGSSLRSFMFVLNERGKKLK